MTSRTKGYKMMRAIALLLLTLLTGCSHYYCYLPGDNTGFPDQAQIDRCK